MRGKIEAEFEDLGERKVMRLWPDFSLSNFLPYKSKLDLDHFFDGLRKAGLLD